MVVHSCHCGLTPNLLNFALSCKPNQKVLKGLFPNPPPPKSACAAFLSPRPTTRREFAPTSQATRSTSRTWPNISPLLGSFAPCLPTLFWFPLFSSTGKAIKTRGPFLTIPELRHRNTWDSPVCVCVCFLLRILKQIWTRARKQRLLTGSHV